MKEDCFTIDIHTQRLHIRKMIPADLEDALEHRLHEDVARYTTDPMTRGEAIAFYKKRMAQWNGGDGEWLSLSIILANGQKAIGELGFNYVARKHNLGEIGYRLNPAYQGNGYAFEAVDALMWELFGNKGLHKLIAICDPRNTGSYRLMEKLKMKKEAHFKSHVFRRGEWCDEYVYSIIRNEIT
ncbi:GNAT family N-acetyltransferase [Fulvivirga sp. 29W222]|uniref:GNAT family N-acetyltransferase n=1 Tax=Fulvivirga marina TaxID=2494733 RepID=A0A937FVG8_9BACT|nr:GNAT family protein [Fulvivirga marina]MBL6445287.1 GNAT family N-acetyltransferase [Fulvivirga marina]